MLLGITGAIVFGTLAWIYIFLKDKYREVVLKKSKDEILLEDLQKEYADFEKKSHLFTSNKKIAKERNEYLEGISFVANRIKEEKNE
jgi:hypothetical protein